MQTNHLVGNPDRFGGAGNSDGSRHFQAASG
jgi:hypothetical protein